MMTLREAAAALGAPEAPALSFDSVSTDTRSLRPGALFVALRGPNHDAHDHLGAALAAGAVGALVQREVDLPLAQIKVADTHRALLALAAHWRARFRIPVVAVTGSNGKTTVKNLLAAILGRMGPVLATTGNRNNTIGAPLTLLELRAEHRHGVLELGMNAPGEIAQLGALVQPQVGVITNAGPAHLAGLGSVAEVARAKGELLDSLADDGVAVLNADDPHYASWRQRAGARRVISFGQSAGACVRGTAQANGAGSTLRIHTPNSQATVQLALPGMHNVQNALAAAAAALALGVPLVEVAAGLASIQPAPGRLCLRPAPNGAQWLDDTYNANPASLAAAVGVLALYPAPRILVLGDMGELGPQAGALHASAGVAAREAGVTRLLALGPLAALAAAAFGAGAQAFEALDPLLSALRPLLAPGATVLVKGSRAAAMERVLAAFCPQPRSGEH